MLPVMGIATFLLVARTAVLCTGVVIAAVPLALRLLLLGLTLVPCRLAAALVSVHVFVSLRKQP